ncbi:lamin tail domain-containing protein [Rhodohalobacter sulfatireducens]|uniref:Lamin tail domain-containing protein n=1 Tax=Rhodohalobacter sulfatireducens TaxID=2911366 RepID=A0ABS9KAZ7_9BACT|nr:lamin tail domain-containing protein [Rhodohalobacter sulfatireducens]MCG2588005.1 lamin tail domain-containing protein [Rhodohalobacter sulfatireducens]
MGLKRNATFRKVLVSIFLMLIMVTKASAQQTILEDDFEDEDLTQNPEWTGDLLDFSFEEVNGNNLLRLNLSDEGSTQIRTESTTTNGVWEFFIDLNFPPSGSNFSEIFLISDTDDFEGDVNGYAIRYGEGGSDDRFKLLRYTNGSSNEILTGTLDLSSGGPFQVRVTRDNSGTWSLYESSGYGGSPSLVGTTNDNMHTSSRHFGFYLEYTSSRADQFFIDDISIENSEPFDVVSAEVSSATEIDVTFNYQIDNTSLDPTDFSIDGGLGNPTSVSPEDDFTVRLNYDSVLPDGNYTLTVNDVDNIYGGMIPADSEADISVTNPFEVVSVNVETSNRISVEFTEPPAETSWNLTDFEITEDASSTGGINPNSIDYDDTSEPNTIYMNLDSSLAIGDYELTIRNVTSTDDWPIVGAREFDFTVSNPFFVTDFEYLSRTEFEITFSQNIDYATLDKEDFEITGFGSPKNVSLEESDQVRITYSTPIDVGERVLEIENISSNSDWQIETGTTVEFTLFDEYDAGDLVISEFYYRVPISWRTATYDRPQYVEIHNRADKLLNLRNFTINDENISIDEDLPIESGEYLVITRGVPVFEEQFGDRNFVEADEFPELVLTTSDEIILETNEDEEIESLTYDAGEWGGDEVSLERYSFDVSADIRDNWAESEDVLTGSPGLPSTITEPTNPPRAVEASFPSPATLRITFSRTLSDDAVDNLGNFSLDNGEVINNAEFTSDPRTLKFDLDDTMEDQFEYTFSYQNVEDIFGNEVSGTQEFNFTFENPFRILSAETDGTNDVLVQFTLPLQVSTVDLSDFELGDGTAPSSFTFDNSETVRLSFGDSFSTGSYEIVVNDLESLTEGWQIEDNSKADFFRFDEYQDGDILITEFMYNPPGGYPQYVELYNQSGRFLTIKNFELLRAEGSTSLGGAITEFDQPIEPGGYLVITEDSELLKDQFGSGPWFEMTEFPGFTQTVSDQIRFLDPDGDPVEMIEYDPTTWGGSEIALERRSSGAPANNPNNWGESLDEDLGTPGEDNTVSPDDAPVLISAEFIDAETVLVTFRGSLDTDVISTGNFDINRSPSISGVSFINSTQTELSLDEEMNSGQSYTITVTNIPDIFGNELDEDQASFTYYFVETSEPGDIVINEFMYDEPDGYTEYVELYNISNKVFNLSGWQQANDTATRRVLTEGQVYFPPESYMIILPNEELLSVFPDIDFINAGSSLPALKNSGDEIVITNAEGVTLDSLRYSSEWGGDEVALERIDQGAISSDMNNWNESLAILKGTPGEENSVDVDTEGPKLLSADYIDEKSIRVLFSGALDQAKIYRSNFDISGGISIDEVTFTSSTEAVLFLDETLNSGQSYTITVSDIPDIFGNELDQASVSFTYYLIETAEPGDVVINEIMYNEPDNYTEYIELYNVSDKAIDLAGWQQANDTASRNILTNEQKILPPNSYIAILPNFNLLNIFQDIPHLNAGTGLSTLKNGGDNVVVANAEGVIIDSLRYRPEWGGDGVSLERRRANRSSLYSENWADSPSEDFGTPGLPNEIEGDFNFIAVGARSISPTSVRVEFNANVSNSNVDPAFFAVDGTRPNSVILETNQILLLEFSDPLESGQRTLVIDDNLRSAGGFSIGEDLEIQFTIFDTFSDGDILINEFMYRPPSGYVRYVELINTSSKLLNLRKWRLQRRDVTGDSERIISEDDLALEPGELIVLTEDSEALQKIFGERNIIELSNFPTFTLTVADQIRLFTNSGSMADSLQYEPSEWGGNGVALERLSYDVESTIRENWAESPNELLGTPGLPNEAEPDVSPPEIVSAAQYQDQGFILTFNERLNSDQATDDENYNITPNLPISMIALDRNEVILFAGDELVNDQEYEITISRIGDIFGNEIESVTVSVRYLEFGDIAPGQVVINEIMYEPSDDSSAEFIEIFNRTDSNYDLSGWLLGDSTDETEIPRGVNIRKHETLVFTDSQHLADDSNKFVFVPDFQSLNNSGDAITLKKSTGSVIDSLYYQADWGVDEPGISLERKDPAGLSTDPGNWESSTSERGSTPGMENSIFEIDESAPEILFANFIHQDSIEVEFNEYVDLALGGENKLAKGGGVQKQAQFNARFLLNGTSAELLYYDEDSGDRVILDGSVVSRGEEVTLSVENLGDYKGNMATQLQQPIAQPISEGDIIFNEIMFDPISEERDGLPDQSQYVEIYNRRSYAISLEGFVLHDEPDEDGEVSIIEPIRSHRQWLPANGYALIYPEPEDIPFTNSRTADFFGLSGNMQEFAIQTDRTTLSLTNTGRQIYLADSTMQTIDMVAYVPEWHNPNIVDTKGISLERINPNFETNDEANWGSNSTPLGGSPGSENSIYQGSEQTISGNDLDFTPNPFSPDGDGFEDNLLINYSFDEPDYLIKVRIYDRFGRLVRKLAEAKRAGFKGSLIWDGKNDDGLRNRVGIYIVLLEAYNSANGKNLSFKETVVIARKF